MNDLPTSNWKTGRIISLNNDGEYKGLKKIKVSLSNGDDVTFFHPPENPFNNEIGDKISYIISNEKYKTAKLVAEPGTIASFIAGNYDTGQSILRQVAFKGVIELCKEDVIDEVDIETYTDRFHTLLNQKNKNNI